MLLIPTELIRQFERNQNNSGKVMPTPPSTNVDGGMAAWWCLSGSIDDGIVALYWRRGGVVVVTWRCHGGVGIGTCADVPQMSTV